jgi:hypothetical protein
MLDFSFSDLNSGYEMPGVRSFIPGKPSQSGHKMESAPFPERVYEAGFGRV